MQVSIKNIVIGLLITMSWLISFPITANAAVPNNVAVENVAVDASSIHHPVTTQSSSAQTLFDQGLTSFFAFDLEEAASLFQKAAAQDPHLAMADWGAALASSPDINQPIDPKQAKTAYDFAQKAHNLSQRFATTDQEKAYINALIERYSSNPDADFKQLMQHYCDRMADLIQQYPSDPDIATLYAEGLMDLQGWQFWDSDQQPLGNTLEIASVLESILDTYPNHLGAQHYYIHLFETSPHPEVAIAHAQQLQSQASTSEHLQHFIEHILSTTKA